MDNFGNIMEGMTGAWRGREPSVPSKKRKKKSDYNSAAGNETSSDGGNRHLENLSDVVLNNLIAEYSKQLMSVKSDEEKVVLNSRIDSIRAELNKRNGVASSTPSSSATQNQAKLFFTGSGMGTSAIIFGAIGFTGSLLINSKHPIIWGCVGAGMGAVVNYHLSQVGKKELIKPI